MSRPVQPLAQELTGAANQKQLANTILFFGAALVLSLGLGYAIVSQSSPVKLLAVIVAACMAAAMVLKPELALYVLALSVYTELSEVLISNYELPSINKALVVVLFVAFLASRLTTMRDRPIAWTRVNSALIAFGVVLIIGALFAGNPNLSFKYLDIYARELIVLLAVANLASTEARSRGVIWAIVLAGAVLGTLSVVQFVSGNFRETFGGLARVAIANIAGTTEGPRAGGPAADPNYFAQTMVIIGTLAFFRLLDEKRLLLKLLGGYTFVVAALTIAFTYSRGGALALVVVVLLTVLRRRMVGALVLLPILLLLPLMNFLPDTFLQRFSSLSTFFGQDDAASKSGRQEASLKGRSSEAQVGIEMFLDHPILGVGPDNYRVLYQHYSSNLGLDPRREDRVAHSLVLETLAEDGLLGFGVYVLFLVFLFLDLARAAKEARQKGAPGIASDAEAVLMAITGYLVTGLFLSTAYPRRFYFLVGLGIAITQAVRYLPANSRETAESTLDLPSGAAIAATSGQAG